MCLTVCLLHVYERGNLPVSQDKKQIVCFVKNEKQYRNSTKSIEKNRDKMADNRENGREKQRNSKKLTVN